MLEARGTFVRWLKSPTFRVFRLFVLVAIASLFSIPAWGVDLVGTNGVVSPGTFFIGESGTIDVALELYDANANTTCGYYQLHQTYTVAPSGFLQINTRPGTSGPTGVSAYSDSALSVACPSCPALNQDSTYSSLGINIPGVPATGLLHRTSL